jgi:hypothetical protein
MNRRLWTRETTQKLLPALFGALVAALLLYSPVAPAQSADETDAAGQCVDKKARQLARSEQTAEVLAGYIADKCSELDPIQSATECGTSEAQIDYCRDLHSQWAARVRQIRRDFAYNLLVMYRQGGADNGATPPDTPKAKIKDTWTVNGNCGADSHTAEGSAQEDLATRSSRFFCDTSVVTFFNQPIDYVMVQFLQKSALHQPVLAFAGSITTDRRTAKIDKIYLQPGQPTKVSRGVCHFFVAQRKLSKLSCTATVNEGERRTIAAVSFDVSPGQ